MGKFRYKAFDEKNNILKSTISDDDIELAKDQLRAKGYRIISIEKISNFDDYQLRHELNDEQLASYCGEIATILDSGVSILRGLEILYEQAEKSSYKKVIKTLLSNVKKGMNLSVAMERTEVFPELLTDMVESGEISSHLVEILFSMESFYEREAAIKSKIRGASIYPLILLAVSMAMLVFFNLFVFKELKTIFNDMTELPKLTKMLIDSLDYINANPVIVLGVIVAIITIGTALTKVAPIKFFLDKISLKLPIIGSVRKNIISARVASSMAIFIQSAVPLTKVLAVVESIAANKYISSLVAIAKEEIIRGRNISDAFEEVQAFDTMMIQMIRIGEETGKLEDMLFKLADIYEKKSNTGIERMVSMIEPLFTLVVGLLVGVIIVAMAMPIFDMSSLIG